MAIDKVETGAREGARFRVLAHVGNPAAWRALMLQSQQQERPMIHQEALKQQAGGHGRRHHQAGGGKSAATHPGARQERLFLALLGGCLGLTLIASAMLRLATG